MIYFIQETGRQVNYIKIGYTRNKAKSRLQTMQTANPSKLKILLTMEGNQAIEKSLHNKFSKDNVIGEWFYPSEELQRYISMQNNTLHAKKDTQVEYCYSRIIDFAKFNLSNSDHYMAIVIISAILVIFFAFLSPDIIAKTFIPMIVIFRILVFAALNTAKRLNIVLARKALNGNGYEVIK